MNAKDCALQGRRILITRAEDQGAGLAQALRSMGAEVLWIPAIRTAAVHPSPKQLAAAAPLDGFQWIAFTSPNAVRYSLGLLVPEGGRPPSKLKVAAVGAATRKALEESRVLVDVLSPEATGKALAETLKGLSPPSRLLLPCGRKGREELNDILTAAGWNVVPFICYDTLPADVPPGAARKMSRGLDAALFASPSAAKNLWAALDASGREILRNAIIVPIGPATAGALQELGLSPCATPADHSMQGLLDALLQALEKAGAGARKEKP